MVNWFFFYFLFHSNFREKKSFKMLLETFYCSFETFQWTEKSIIYFSFAFFHRYLAVWAAVTMEWWSSKSLGQEGGCSVSSVPCILGEQTLTSSGFCLIAYCGINTWKEEVNQKAGWYLRIACSKFRSNVAQERGNQAKMPGGLCEWTRSSWTNSNTYTHTHKK